MKKLMIAIVLLMVCSVAAQTLSKGSTLLGAGNNIITTLQERTPIQIIGEKVMDGQVVIKIKGTELVGFAIVDSITMPLGFEPNGAKYLANKEEALNKARALKVKEILARPATVRAETEYSRAFKSNIRQLKSLLPLVKDPVMRKFALEQIAIQEEALRDEYRN
jgi:hypothetical protein